MVTSALFSVRREISMKPTFYPLFLFADSLINNQLGTSSLKNGTSQVASKGLDWSIGSIQAYLSEWFIFIYCRVILQKMGWSKNKPNPFVFIL